MSDWLYNRVRGHLRQTGLFPREPPENCERIELTEYSSRPSLAHCRYWTDNEMVAWLDSPPTGPPHTRTVWASPAEEEAYWTERCHPLARTEVGGAGTFHADSEWLASLSRLDPLRGLDLRASVEVAGVCVDPSESSRLDLTVVDGLLAPSAADFAAELSVSGAVEIIVEWLAGRTAIRDIASELEIDGNFLLLGGLASVFAIPGYGMDLPDDTVDAARCTVDLIQDHRALADDLRM